MARLIPQNESTTQCDGPLMAPLMAQGFGKVFCQVLEDAGVYKNTEEGRKAFHRFLEIL